MNHSKNWRWTSLIVVIGLLLSTMTTVSAQPAVSGGGAASPARPPEQPASGEGSVASTAAPVEVDPPPPLIESASAADEVLSLIEPELRDVARAGGEELVKVTVLVAPGTDLERYFERSLVVAGGEFDRVVGLVAAGDLIKVASIEGTLAVLNMEERQPPNPPDPFELMEVEDPPQPVVRSLDDVDPAPLARELDGAPASRPGSPDSFYTNDTNGVWATWSLGITGDGDVVTDPLKLAVVDTGVDFANPDLFGSQARVTDPASPYYDAVWGAGWPIAFDDRSMSDYALDIKDYRGNWGWYMNASVQIQDPDLGSTDPFTFSVMHPDLGVTVTYVISTPIQLWNANGGLYSFGWHPDDALAGGWGETPGVLVSGEGSGWGPFDTIYVDMTVDYTFDYYGGDGWAGLGQEIACVNLGWSAPGACDISGGMAYYISNGTTPIPASDWLYGLGSPPPGVVVAFMLNDVTENGGDHGTLCAGTAVGRGRIVQMPYAGTYGDTYWPPTWYNPSPWPGGHGGISHGPGRDTGLVAMGNYYAGGSSLNYYDFVTLGYDGVPAGDPADTHDQPHIYTNSYGSGAVENDGWDLSSRYVTLLNYGYSAQQGIALPNGGDYSALFVGSTGNSGFGYGTVTSPQPESAVMVGVSTVFGQYNLGDYAQYRDWVNWGHLGGFSDRGPTSMSSLGVHVLANGFFGSGNVPLNYFYGGDMSVDFWSGTSRSGPEVGGILALIYDAYYQVHGSYPSWREARALLMNGARTTFSDPMAQGAGLANAINAVDIIQGTRGGLVTNEELNGYWIPGTYRGTEYPGFARGLFSGESDTETFSVTNFDATDPLTVALDAVTMELIDHREWNFTSLPLAQEGPGTRYYGRRLFGPPGSNPGYGAADPFYIQGVDDGLLADADLLVVRMSYPYEEFEDDINSNWWFLYGYAWRDVDVADSSWFTDTNGNGVQNSGEFQDETVRINYDYHGNTTEIRIREPMDLIQGNVWPHEPAMAVMDDIVLMLRHFRYGGYDTTDLAVTVELYKEVEWAELELDTPDMVVPPASTLDFNVTAHTIIPLSTLLSEDFEGAFPPAGWQVFTNTIGGEWARNDTLGHPNHCNFGDGFSAASGMNGSSGIAWDTELWSPPIDLSSVGEMALLRYASNFQDYAGNGEIWLDISTDSGTTWTNLRYQSSDDPVGGTLEEEDLSAYIGQTIMLRWRYAATSITSWYWHIDNVEVLDTLIEPPGEYTGYIRVTYSDPYTYSEYIPVQKQIWFPSEIDPQLGGVDQPTLYDNGVVYGATGPSPYQRAESGDWRFFYTDVDAAALPPNLGTYMLAHTTWEAEGDAPNDTDIDTLFYAPEPHDPLFLPFGSIFGPSSLAVAGGSLRAGSGPDWEYHTTTGGPDDWSSIRVAEGGLHGVATQVVRWGGEQTEVPFTTTVGTVQVTPFIRSGGFTCISCTVPLVFKTNHADLEGLALEAIGYGFTQPVHEMVPVTQSLSSYVYYTISADDAYKLEVTTFHPNSNVDADLVVYYWTGSTWVAVGSSGRSDSNERVLLTNPPAGDYRVEIYGYAIPGGATDVQLDVEEISGAGAMTVSGLPSAIVPGTLYELELHFEDTPDVGVWNGALYLGPEGSPTAIEIPVLLDQGGAEKTAWQETVQVGDLVTYTIALTQSPMGGVGWDLEDVIPAGFELVSVEGADVITGAGGVTITWSGADCLFDWLAMTDPLPLVSGSSDDGHGALVIPFDLAFFTETITATTELKVSTNGYATFGDDGTDYSNDDIPSTIDPNAYVGPLWDDQEIKPADPDQGLWYGVHGDAPTRVLAVEWNIQDLGTLTDPNHFQAQIGEDGDIWFLYDDVNEDRGGTGDSATIGLENSTGTSGTLYSYNTTGAVADNFAIHFSPNASGTYDVLYAGSNCEFNFGTHAITLTLRAVSVGEWTNTAYVMTGDRMCPISDTVNVVGALPTWDKEIWIEGNGPFLPADGPFPVLDGDAVVVVDRVSVSDTNPITYTLLEEWTASLGLVGYDMDFGSVYTAPGSLEWSVTAGMPSTWYVLTKTFEVNGEAGWVDFLTETLSVEGGPVPEMQVVEFYVPFMLDKQGPDTTDTGDVISYTLRLEMPDPIPLDGSLILTDVLPAGVEFAGNLTATYGSAWYVPGDGAVYWNNAAGAAAPAPAGFPTYGPLPALDVTSFASSGEAVDRPQAPTNPEAVLWDQPLSTSNTNTYANQDFETANDGYDIFIADDFNNALPWVLDTIFVDNNVWNTGCDFTCASALNWHIYADDGGMPDGDPWGGGNAPVWSASLPPTDTQIVLSAGVGGYQTNVTLNLDTPVDVSPGAWWLVFYPSMDFGACGCQTGRHVADTTNGYHAHVINPGGGFGFPTTWTPITDASTWGISDQDLAFRLEGGTGVLEPSVVTITFDVTVTAQMGDVVTNVVFLDDGFLLAEAEHVFQVSAPTDYTWEKDVTVNGTPYTGDPVEPGDQIQVVDSVMVHYDGWASTVLTETWSASLDMTAFEFNAGTVVTGTGILVWDGMGTEGTWLVLTKTFTVLDVPEGTNVLTETLVVETFAPEVRTIDFVHEGFELYLPVVFKDF
jgi:hypothetical protein